MAESRKLKKARSSKRKPSESDPLKELKISDAILRLCEPLRKKYKTEPRITSIVDLTIMAWNLSLVPEHERENTKGIFIDRLSNQLEGEDISALLETMDTLIEQKIRVYPHVNACILKRNLSMSEDKLTLTVTTAPFSASRSSRDTVENQT